MRIGDRVRLLRGTEEGSIVAFKGDKIVEIEIDDGFVIPAMRNEVVVISSREAEQFPDAAQPEVGKSQGSQDRRDVYIPQGLFLGLEETEENRYKAYVINGSDDVVLFTVSQYDKKIISGKAYGVCKPFESQNAGALTSSIFNTSKKLLVQILFFEQQARIKKGPLNVELGLEKSMLSEKTYVEPIEAEVYLIKIEERQVEKIDPQKIKEQLFEPRDPVLPSARKNKPKSKEMIIDLHVDELKVDLNENEILSFQLNEFEKAFDSALVSDIEKLKVIHGVGAGILRGKIHKRLSAKKEVRYFEDGDKEKFGFGSTIIYF